MPRKKEITLYSFEELSAKAKKRAIEEASENFRWDDNDSHHLSDLFENDISDYYGLGEDMKVEWDLGYSQSGGVCFKGPVDIEKFIKAELEKHPEVKRFEALIPFVSAKITNKGRDCHYNSMDVEVDLNGNPGSLLPDDLQNPLSTHRWKSDQALNLWWAEKSQVEQARRRPIEEWREKVHEWTKKMGRPWASSMRDPHKHPKAWLPGQPSNEPPPELDIPYPPEPDVRMPEPLRAAYQEAEKEWAKIEKLTVEFQAYLEERVEEISREMQESGYKEIEYHDSEANIIEMIEANELEFLETGEIYK